MKVLAFILSAYLLFLLTVPCCSFDNCPDEKITQEADHEKGDGDCGSCSPFFACTGCSGFTVLLESNHIEIVSMVSVHEYTGYILSFIPDVHYDFWQPPKVA
jgi:hypothetical protein